MKRIIKDRLELAIDELHRIFYVENGVLKWRVRMSIGATIGKPAGGKDGHGYMAVKIKGRTYQCHRIIWAMANGRWPELLIDHDDVERSNNGLENLREADFSQNGANRRMHRNNTSGFKGASWYAPSGKWTAKIRKDGRLIHLGYHDTVEAAHAAYCAAATKLFGQFARAA